MKNRELAEKIYNHLNEKGAGLGNISIILIESVLDKELLQPDMIKSACECTCSNSLSYSNCDKKCKRYEIEQDDR